MNKKSIGLTILGIILILSLSGCFSHRFEVMHNPDGSGKFTIETIFTEDYLGMLEDNLSMDDTDDDVFVESMFNKDDLVDSRNIRSVTEDSFVDPETGALHEILEIEIVNILEPVLFDQGDDNEALFEIIDQGDGSYRFTVTLEAPSEFTDEGMDDDLMLPPEMFRNMLQGSTITWQLSVDELIEADPSAEFHPANKTVTWEIPLTDVLFSEENLNIFAIYRPEGSQNVIEPQPVETATPTLGPEYKQEEATPTSIPNATESPIRPTVDLDFEQPRDGFFGLPNWVPIVLVAVLCLGGIFVVIAAVVIILVVRKGKQNQTQNKNE